MKINKVAKLTGITVRTLHYYDEIGLLKPSEITESGYRIYDNKALETLQQILFFRELDFSLNEIKEIMESPYFDKTEALNQHKELLIKKRMHLDGLINLITDRIKGEKEMNFEAFDTTEIEATKKQYAVEVKERWGNTSTYAQSKEKTSSYDSNKWQMISDESQDILKAFAHNRDNDSEGEITQELVKKWQEYITAHFYDCTKEILSCLGLMYVSDERFKANIDKNGEGTASFMAKAIEFYCMN